MKRLTTLIAVLCTGALLLLAGCSAGGGTTTATDTQLNGTAKSLSGTAAAGAPIVGSVTIKDSTGKETTKTIEADGKYTVDVSDMTGPFMVRADGFVGGNEYHLYSAATQADVGGTINVTPLTDLIVANIAGSLAKTYFDSGSFSNLTATQLNTETAALQAKLLPTLQALGVSDSIDLLRASFSTDHSGLDAALDVLKVSVDPATQIATIKNVITLEEIKSDLAQKTYTGTMTKTDGLATGVTAIQAMNDQLKKFSDLFATSLPSPTDVRLVALFDLTTFMSGGRNLADFLSGITTEQSMVGITFTNLVINSINAGQDAAEVSFTVVQNGTATNDGPGAWKMVKKEGVWLMQGDLRIADVSVKPRAEYHPGNTSNAISTGLNLNIEDRGAQGIDSAVVTGPGLPVSGVTLNKQMQNSWFAIVGQYGGNTFNMDDSTIAGIPDNGAVYTIKLYSGGTLKATYQEKLNKRPYKPSELTAASFPAFTAPSSADLSAFAGGNLTVSWTLPTGLGADWLEMQLNNMSGQTVRAEYSLKATATSQVVTITPLSNPVSCWVWLNARDSSGRQLSTSIYTSGTATNVTPAPSFSAAAGSYNVTTLYTSGASIGKTTSTTIITVDANGNVSGTDGGVTVVKGYLMATSVQNVFTFTGTGPISNLTLQGSLDTSTGKFGGTFTDDSGSGTWSWTKANGTVLKTLMKLIRGR